MQQLREETIVRLSQAQSPWPQPCSPSRPADYTPGCMAGQIRLHRQSPTRPHPPLLHVVVLRPHASYSPLVASRFYVLWPATLIRGLQEWAIEARTGPTQRGILSRVAGSPFRCSCWSPSRRMTFHVPLLLSFTMRHARLQTCQAGMRPPGLAATSSKSLDDYMLAIQYLGTSYMLKT
jgi:hypothetical protein